ncbi:phosphoribosylglycinamide formyltransferase [Alteribacillus sp. HJP-4]|uniref:phosphoribosylglycinamide formyltransferase n=1 Tax=Alteribacillus sp. HJP-4 TaxID=2775394 RepID=UPI0035CCDB5D
MNIAVFASGNGSNFQAIADAVKEGRLKADIKLLVCDKPEAGVVERASQAGVPVFCFRPKSYENKAAFEKEIVEELESRQVEIIALAGYMRLIGDTLLHAFDRRIVNIHPSLLPAFQGKDAIGQAWKAGVKVTGVTIHWVDAGIDTGEIIAQQPIDIKESDSLRSLTAAIQAEEHRLYPDTLQRLTSSISRRESEKI